MKKTHPAVRTFRLLRLTLHLAAGLTEVGTTFAFRGPQSRRRAIGRWSRHLLHLLGIRVQPMGHVPSPQTLNTMLVANHISWIDIFVMNAVVVSRFVAKAEVQGWPLIGWLSARTGTLFVTREKRQDAVRVNSEICTVLKAGDCIALFPEGSTTDGRTVQPFNSALLQPAVETGAHLIPVALRYRNRQGAFTDSAAYVGDMTLIDSFLKLAAEPAIVAELHFFEAIPSESLHRRELAKRAEGQIRRAVCGDTPTPTPEANPETACAEPL